jgi:hypothetical protein
MLHQSEKLSRNFKATSLNIVIDESLGKIQVSPASRSPDKEASIIIVIKMGVYTPLL